MDELFDAFTSPNLDFRHDAEVRIAAEIRSNPAVADEIFSRFQSGNADTRWYLSRTLIKAGDMVIPLILKKSETETDSDVQRYFSSILASFGEQSVIPLIGLFSSENALARGMAGAALEKIGTPAVPFLLNAAKSENALVKSCSGIVLMKLGVYQF